MTIMILNLQNIAYPRSEKMTNRICFIAESPFSKRDYQRFGIFEIMQLGYEVLVLDCTPFLLKKFDRKVNGEKLCIKKSNVVRCYSIFDLIKNILIFKPKWCIDFLGGGYAWKNYLERASIRIFLKLFSKIVLYKLGSLPSPPVFQNKNPISKIKREVKIKILDILSLPLKIFNEDKVAIGGYTEFNKVKNKKKVIFAHNLDYDLYLMQNSKKSNARNMGLFMMILLKLTKKKDSIKKTNFYYF